MSSGPVLLCFDGSDDAAVAIAAAGELLASRKAVVVTVWEPVAVWEPYDPGALLSAGVASVGSEALGLDEIANRLARDKVDQGVELARAAGFDARGEIARGKTWHAICETADALDAAAIVLGARGLSRVQSMLLGSVSSAVATHAKRPVLVIPHHPSADPED
ncbi:MAG TPA: universal stress protein [Solirubrobacteraceae bacterium]|nr:universal stress protein [Solirubrobacteraceae bacterium]